MKGFSRVSWEAGSPSPEEEKNALVLQEFPRGNKLFWLNLAVLTITGETLQLVNAELSTKFIDTHVKRHKTISLSQPIELLGIQEVID